MHPALDELLEMRDGGGSAVAREHVAGCDKCRAELVRLSALRDELRALPPDRPPADIWPVVARRASAARRTRRLKMAAAAAIFIAAAGAGGAIWWRHVKALPQNASAAVPSPAASTAKAPDAPTQKPPEQDIAALIVQSQKLESLIKKYEAQAPVLNGRSAGAVANIQERLALIDLQIGLADATTTPKDRLAQLWKYRVQLLAALVELHDSRGAYISI